MKGLSYRKLQKSDYTEVQNIISDAFGLHNYVNDKKLLVIVKKMYLSSCLSEQKFNMVAVREGEIVGIIMGGSKNDKFKLSNILNVLKMLYYGTLLWFKIRNKKGGFNEINRAYSELIAGMKDDLDGVLTLFAIKEDMRGLGIGKELLSRLNEYYLAHNTKRIYLYTDDTCNYGFYEHMGFERPKEKQVTVWRNNKKEKLDVYLYTLDL